MELALGQYHRSGIFTVWKHVSFVINEQIVFRSFFSQVCPLVKGIGWATVLINFMTGMFYNTIISWAVYYLFSSFHGIFGDLPWKDCSHPWNTKCCVAADAKEYPTNRANLSSIISKNCTQWFYSTEEYFLLVFVSFEKRKDIFQMNF